MSSKGDISRSESDPESKPQLLRLAIMMDRVGRVLLCLVILVAVVFCVRTVQEIRSADERRAESLRKPERDPMDSLQEMLNGDWQFADVPWSVQIREVPHVEAMTKFNAAVQQLKPSETETEGDPIASLLDLLGARVSEDGGNATYHLEAGSLQAVGFAPKDEPKQVQLVRAMQQIDQDRWNFVELVKKTRLERESMVGTQVLLPHGSENATLAVRRDATGSLCAELIELNSDLEKLCTLWTDAGWQVKAHSGGSAETSQKMFACTRESQTIFVIVPAALANAPRTLLLIRST